MFTNIELFVCSALWSVHEMDDVMNAGYNQWLKIVGTSPRMLRVEELMLRTINLGIGEVDFELTDDIYSTIEFLHPSRTREAFYSWALGRDFQMAVYRFPSRKMTNMVVLIQQNKAYGIYKYSDTFYFFNSHQNPGLELSNASLISLNINELVEFLDHILCRSERLIDACTLTFLRVQDGRRFDASELPRAPENVADSNESYESSVGSYESSVEEYENDYVTDETLPVIKKKGRRKRKYTKCFDRRRKKLRNSVKEEIVPNIRRPLALTDFQPEYYNIGAMNKSCPYCGAMYFEREHQSKIKFMSCCQGGKVFLSNQYYDRNNMPSLFTDLFIDKHPHSQNFKANIRQINSALAMASIKTKAPVTLPGVGPRVILMHGVFYTMIFDPTKDNEETASYAQLYFLDPAEAQEERFKHKANRDIEPQLLEELDDFMRRFNPFTRKFLSMKQVVDSEMKSVDGDRCKMRTIAMVFKKSRDQNRYNAPTSDDIAIVYNTLDGLPPEDVSFAVYVRRPDDKAPKCHYISHLDRSSDPMTYPVLHPTGTFGWTPNLPHGGSRNTAKRTNVSIREFYSYKFARRNDSSLILQGGQLTQQFICHAFLKKEASDINWIRNNQAVLRVESYKNLGDALINDKPHEIGRKIILPATFHNSPRYYHQLYQDSMAVVRKFGMPSYFITITCNPKWPELSKIVKNTTDAPDLVARVFNSKIYEIINDLHHKKIFGRVVYCMYRVEWQKRGLPHIHLLLSVAEESKPKSVADIDAVVCAHIPSKENKRLFEAVTKHMVHGPCGHLNYNSVCMVNGRCSKHFPKDFNEITVFSNKSGYPIYRRPNNGVHINSKKSGKIMEIDNRWIVPYNPYLLLKYDCHINVEICTSLNAIKYICKYIFKGNDAASLEAKMDETVTYMDHRYVSAPEAAWRIFRFRTHYCSHTVYRLPVHTSEEKSVCFRPEMTRKMILENAERDNELTAFFKLNNICEDRLLYQDVPSLYTFDKKQRLWKLRLKRKNGVVGRLHSASPLDHERFALRLLLLNIPAPKSYEDMKTVNGVVMESFTDAAKARGLLEDDNVWACTLQELCDMNSPKNIRITFAIMLCYNYIPHPIQLYERFEEQMCEDFFRQNSDISDDEARFRCLSHINEVLVSNSRSITEFNLFLPTGYSKSNDGDEIITPDDLAFAENAYINLNQCQKDIYGAVIERLSNPQNSNIYFIDGPGGTGKTTLFKALIARLRVNGKKVLSVAYTGIAASLLKNGMTAHSAFGLPVDLQSHSTSKIKPKSKDAANLRSVDVIIFDEAPMAPNHMYNAIDRLLRELMGNNLPFGGKIVILSGDFRQMLPVVENGSRLDVINSCLKRNPLWSQIRQFQLVNNMRAKEDQEFSKWLLELGQASFNDKDDNIIIPKQFLIEGSLEDFVFPESIRPGDMEKYFANIILCPTNAECHMINDRILDRIEGEDFIYSSIDTIDSSERQPGDLTNYPTEFLNSLNNNGLPLHKLRLKVGAIVILIRNLDKNNGLCNGSRFIVTELGRNIIMVKSEFGKEYPIPRIDLLSRSTSYPFRMRRRQFPLRLAFSSTINKSQGQTFDRVGLFLNTDIFTHGQLYVAFSRVRSAKDIKVSGQKNAGGDNNLCSRNIVFREILSATESL